MRNILCLIGTYFILTVIRHLPLYRIIAAFFVLIMIRRYIRSQYLYHVKGRILDKLALHLQK